MNRNVLIVLAGGFLIAVLVALLVQATLSGGDEPAPVVEEDPKVDIIVAAQDLEAGDELTADNMRWQSWPEDGVFPNAVIREDDEETTDLLSGTLRRAVSEGEPVLENAIIQEGQGNFVAATLRPGMRAVSLNVTAPQMVAGFVMPGDHVDIIMTYEVDIEFEGPDTPAVENMINQSVSEVAAETILENVRVLAVDQTYRNDDGEPRVGRTVTLEVDRRGAETLAVSNSLGELSMALRKIGDDTLIGQPYPVVTDVRLSRIYNELYSRLEAFQGPEENSSGQRGDFVRIYRGGTVQTVPVNP